MRSQASDSRLYIYISELASLCTINNYYLLFALYCLQHAVKMIYNGCSVLLNGNLIGLRQATHYTFNEFVQELVSNTSVVSDVFLPLDELLVIALKLFQRHFVNFRQVVGVLFEIFL